MWGPVASCRLTVYHASTGRDMVGALGAEVDRLETEIQQIMPGIRHIDLVRPQVANFFENKAVKASPERYRSSHPMCSPQ